MARPKKINADPRFVENTNTNTNNMEENTMVNTEMNAQVVENVEVAENVNEIGMDKVKEIFATKENVWVNFADKIFLKVGDVVVVKRISANTGKDGDAPKTKFTVTLSCQRKGPKGGTFYTFHKFFTDAEFSLGQIKMVTSGGNQWFKRYISKDAKLEDCNFKAKNGLTYTKRVRSNNDYKATGLVLR